MCRSIGSSSPEAITNFIALICGALFEFFMVDNKSHRTNDTKDPESSVISIATPPISPLMVAWNLTTVKVTVNASAIGLVRGDTGCLVQAPPVHFPGTNSFLPGWLHEKHKQFC